MNPGNEFWFINALLIRMIRACIELFSNFTYTSFMMIKNTTMNRRVIGNRKIMKSLMVFLFLTVNIGTFGQDDHIPFKRILIEDGLSQSTINCILQDKKGFMWFGTMDGLNRYDGNNFEVYDNINDSEGISDIDIWSIFEDSSGFLWVGTNTGGVNRFDRKTGKFYRYNISNGKLNYNDVRVIIEDSQGIIWVGTHGRGIYRYDKYADSFLPLTMDIKEAGVISNQIRVIRIDRYGVWWIGTEDGLYILERQQKSFIHLTTSNERVPTHLKNNRITAIYEDKEGVIWIGASGCGLNKFSPLENRFTTYRHVVNNSSGLSSNDISVIFEDSKGAIWIGTYDGGLNRFDRKTGKFINYKYNPGNPLCISKNYITSIFEDSSGTLWFGTKAAGLNILPKNSIPFSLHRFSGSPDFGLNYNDIRSFYEDSSGILWIGTFEGGLIQFNRETEKYTNYKFDEKNSNKLQINPIWSVHEDRSGRLWIGTGGALNKLDRNTRKFTRYQLRKDKPNGIAKDEVLIIHEDGDGNLWLGTSGGLEKFNLKTEKFTHYQNNPNDENTLSNNIILSIYEEYPGLFWIGTKGGGLNKFDIKKGSFTRYQHKEKYPINSLSHNEVKCICKDHSGVLWVGTSYGLNKLEDEKEGKFKIYLEKDGLPNNMIYSILEDKQGNLWMGTNRGLSKFDGKSTFKNYDSNDGLQSDEFNRGALLKNKKGEMFFGGINGFNIFFPDKIKDDPFIPPIVITDLLIDNISTAPEWKNPGSPLKNTIDETHELTLTYRQSNVFSFEFAALHYANPRKNQYKYKLEGWDIDWVETEAKIRRATYTNLPSGEYTFKVKGSNKDGVWNEQGAAVRLRILPPPWLTWWAYTLYVIAVIAILFLIWTAWSKRLLKQKNEELGRKNIELKNTQTQLIQSEKMASLGTLLFGVAHELNNPAAFLKLNSEFFAKTWKDIVPLLERQAQNDTDFKIGGLHYKDSKEDIEKLIPGLLDGSNRIKVIIDDLKIFSRKEDTLKMEKIDLPKVIRSSINLTQHMIKKSTNNFSFENGETLPCIYGNFQRLEQVFINLIQNACQALTDNTQGIFISAAHDKIGSQVVIKVKDEGIGIDEKDLKYITDPFFTTKRDTGGIGLGLSISLQIIQEHGGSMNFESKPGKGTTVFVHLPVHPRDEKKKL